MAIPSKYEDGGDMEEYLGIGGEILDSEKLEDGTILIHRMEIRSVSVIGAEIDLVDSLTGESVEVHQIGGSEILTSEEISELTEGVTDAPPKPKTETDRPRPPRKD